MLGAGLTPWQALSAATRTPGEFIAKTVPGAAKFGVVAPGYRADLLLVADNPIDKPATLRTPLGVMAGGRWYDAAALQRMLKIFPERDVVHESARVPPPHSHLRHGPGDWLTHWTLNLHATSTTSPTSWGKKGTE